MPEDRPTISSSRVAAADVARHSFGTARRGFDPQEVRAYLELVARELSAWEQHEQDLRQELADAEERSRNPVIDEATLTAALGQQSAAVLRKAHDEAARIALHADETAAVLVREAQQQASEALVRAESGAAERIAEAEIAASTVHQQTSQEAAATLDAARAEGEALVERARQQGRAMIDQAQEARRRILADMAQRRRAVTLQIEQFRAARDELAAAVLGVRDSVDRVVGDLVRADDDARAAAAELARRQPTEVPEGALTVEVERAVADLEATAGGIFDVEDLGPADRRSLPAVPSASGAGPPGVDQPAGPADGRSEPDASGQPSAAAEGRVDRGLDVGAVDDPGEVDAVEDLFARLRASHPGSQGQNRDDPARAAGTGEATPAEGTPVEAIAGEPSDDDLPVGSPATPAEAEAEPETEPEPEPEAQPGEDGAVEVVGVGVVAGESPEAPPEEGTGDDEELDADAAAVARRGELLDPIVAKLARRLKRALQDDQNRLLDQLRNGPAERTGDLLPPEEEQQALYVEAASAQLREAAVAGIAFARRELGTTRGRPPGPDEVVVGRVADGLAGTVVTLLRRRLDDGREPAGAGAADRVGAAYREWRGVRIERLVGDAALEAFSAGVVAASGSTGLRWVLAGGGTGCADCDDNSLAGTIGKGEEFPTGHHHPPAHAGCRCLVVPTPA
ncbi:MAG TPA: DivIVA domain-containing protein [Acidimicrobiales bacterium]|jgi:DivIVA domain-containing protein|nr:DivIVA domain-containing protein [Acidimicrobiales bacterium]